MSDTTGASRADPFAAAEGFDPERPRVSPELAWTIAYTGRPEPGAEGFLPARPAAALGLVLRPLLWLLSLLSLPLLLVIRVYKAVLSPLLPPACRFEPSCSVYTYVALRRFGLIRGGLLGLLRLIRCQPICAMGYDPVPPPERPEAMATTDATAEEPDPDTPKATESDPDIAPGEATA